MELTSTTLNVCGFVINICVFSKGTQIFDFIEHNTIPKLA